MQADDLVVIHAAPHPSPAVQERGFGLDHPYVELCWTARVGPASTALLRRLPLLWQETEPARMPAAELASALGMEGTNGLRRSIGRLVKYGLARQPAHLEMAAYTSVPPLPARFLQHAPRWVRRTHQRLLVEHQLALAGADAGPGSAGPVPALARLNRLRTGTTVGPSAARSPLGQ